MKHLRLALIFAGLLSQGAAVYMSWDISEVFYFFLDNMQTFQMGAVLSLLIYLVIVISYERLVFVGNKRLKSKDVEIQLLNSRLKEMEEKLKEPKA